MFYNNVENLPDSRYSPSVVVNFKDRGIQFSRHGA